MLALLALPSPAPRFYMDTVHFQQCHGKAMHNVPDNSTAHFPCMLMMGPMLVADLLVNWLYKGQQALMALTQQQQEALVYTMPRRLHTHVRPEDAVPLRPHPPSRRPRGYSTISLLPPLLTSPELALMLLLHLVCHAQAQNYRSRCFGISYKQLVETFQQAAVANRSEAGALAELADRARPGNFYTSLGPVEKAGGFSPMPPLNVTKLEG